MPTFETKYSTAQKEAVAIAYKDRGIRPAKRVVELASRGELEHNGEKLDPFDISADMVRQAGARLLKGRAGTLKSGLTDAPPQDAIEALRKRLVSAADDALKRCEARLRSPKMTGKDIEMARQVARLIREAAAIPGPNDPRRVPPGEKIPGAGVTNDGKTNGGLAGTIIAAHNGKGGAQAFEDDPRQNLPQDTDPSGDNSAAQQADNDGEHGDHGAPGSWMREEVSAIPA